MTTWALYLLLAWKEFLLLKREEEFLRSFQVVTVKVHFGVNITDVYKLSSMFLVTTSSGSTHVTLIVT